MSETIQGSKSLLYSKSDIPGISNTGDSMQHQSVQEVSGKRGAADVVIHGTTVVSTGHIISAGSVKKKIVSAAHGAKRGWVMRPSTGNSSSEEIVITEIIDANTFAIAYEADLAIADTFDLLKFITPNYTSTGDLNVVVTASGPVQYLKDAVITTVSEDTVTPANTNALPVKIASKAIVDNLFFPYVGVSDAGYTELIAATPDDISAMTYFESGGFPTVLALGAMGLEVDLFMIPPGGLNGEIPINIPSGSRVSIKELVSDAISADAYIVANFYK